MRTSALRPAVLAVGLFACLTGAPAALAQSSFVLEEPVLVADGRRVPVEGAPLQQNPFGMLVLSVPDIGTYTVADRPFEGARLAGEFDGPELVFAAAGVSVRLRGREPLLGGPRRDAWVRTTPATGARGPARLSLVSPAQGADPVPRAPVRSEPDDSEAVRAEVTALRADVARLDAEVARLTGVLAQTRAERDRLTELTSIQPPEAASGGADALAAELARVRSELSDASGRLRETERSLLTLQVETDGLRSERDHLQGEVARLRAEVSDRRQRPTAPQPPTPPSQPAPLVGRPASGASIELSGFDFGRLANPDQVRQRLDATEYPPLAARSGLAGDVLVLFQTDPEGHVIRTAVARPLGGGLDALAEDLVRSMRFVPPIVEGRPTGLRSQVVVRFSL